MITWYNLIDYKHSHIKKKAPNDEGFGMCICGGNNSATLQMNFSVKEMKQCNIDAFVFKNRPAGCTFWHVFQHQIWRQHFH